MLLKAKESAMPLIIPVGGIMLTLLAILWDFFHRTEFTLNSVGTSALVFIVALIIMLGFYLQFRSFASVQLDEDGVSFESLFFSGNRGRLPKFKRMLLPWKDVIEVTVRLHEIKLRSAQLVVHINTLYFKDAHQVFQFIEEHRPPSSDPS